MKSDNLLAGGERGGSVPVVDTARLSWGLGALLAGTAVPLSGKGGAAASLLTRSSKGGPLTGAAAPLPRTAASQHVVSPA